MDCRMAASVRYEETARAQPCEGARSFVCDGTCPEEHGRASRLDTKYVEAGTKAIACQRSLLCICVASANRREAFAAFRIPGSVDRRSVFEQEPRQALYWRGLKVRSEPLRCSEVLDESSRNSGDEPSRSV